MSVNPVLLKLIMTVCWPKLASKLKKKHRGRRESFVDLKHNNNLSWLLAGGGKKSFAIKKAQQTHSELMVISGGFPVAFCMTRNIFVTISMTCPVWNTKSPFFRPSSDCDFNFQLRFDFIFIIDERKCATRAKEKRSQRGNS